MSKKIIGTIILAMPFIGLLALCIYRAGFWCGVGVFCLSMFITACICGFVILGVNLLSDDEANKD